MSDEQMTDDQFNARLAEPIETAYDVFRIMIDMGEQDDGIGQLSSVIWDKMKELKADDVYQQEIIQKYNEENTMFHEKIKRLEEENEKLKEGKTLLRAIGTMMIDAHIAEHPEDAMAKEGFASEAEYQAWKKKAMGIPVWYWIS